MKTLKSLFACLLLGLVALSTPIGCDVPPAPVNTVPETTVKPVVDDTNTAALRQRATDFGNLLMKLRTMTEDEAHYELQFFIKPSPELRSETVAYYQDFSAKSKKFTILSQSVTNIQMASDGTSARVTFDMVAQAPDGKQIPAAQETIWLQVEGTWYRSTNDPTKRLR